MSWVKDFQKVLPWLSGLPLLPKLLVSLIVVAVAALVLALIWTIPPREGSGDEMASRQAPAPADRAKAVPVPQTSAESPPAVPNLALKTKWEGVWDSAQGFRFSFVMHLDIGSDNTANGYILWRLLHTPPSSPLANRVNEPGTEFVRGSINRDTGEVALAGYKVDNPTLLALDRYRFFVSSDGQTFRGLSQNTDGSWQTAINGAFSIVQE